MYRAIIKTKGLLLKYLRNFLPERLKPYVQTAVLLAFFSHRVQVRLFFHNKYNTAIPPYLLTFVLII